MEANERLAKAKGYLDHRAFCLKSDLMRIRNAYTLIDNAMKDIKKLERQLDKEKQENKLLKEIIKGDKK